MHFPVVARLRESRSTTASLKCACQTHISLLYSMKYSSIVHCRLLLSSFVELMIGFGRIECSIGFNLSGNREPLSRSHLLDVGVGHLPLIVVVNENHRSVLWADVGALPVDLRRIMAREKHLQQLGIGRNSMRYGAACSNYPRWAPGRCFAR